MRSSRSLSVLLVGAMLVPVLALADDDDASSSSSSMTSSSSSSSVSSSSSSSSSISSSSSSSSVPDSSKGRRRKALEPIVAGCIQTAVDAREQSVLTAVTTYTSSVLSAFQQKKSALHDAWAIADNGRRKAAVKSAWTAFAQTKRVAKKTYKDARQTAWSTFKKTAKLCNESMSDENYKANEDL